MQTASLFEEELPKPTQTKVELLKSDVLTVAICPDFPPFCYTNAKKQIMGVEYDLLELIAQRLGKKLKTQSYNNIDLSLKALEDGKADIAIGAITPTPYRQNVFALSDPYCYLYTSVYIKTEETGQFATLEDMETVGLLSGNKQAFAPFVFATRTYEDMVDMVYGLKNGEIQGFIAFDYLIDHIKNMPGWVEKSEIKTDQKAFPLVIAANKDFALMGEIDEVIASDISEAMVEKLLLKHTNPVELEFEVTDD